MAVVLPLRWSEIAADIIVPGAHRLLVGAGYIGIVIAGNDRRVCGIAERAQPSGGRADLDAARQIDEVPGDGQVIGLMGADVVEQQIQRAAEKVLASISMPVHKACYAF